MANINNFKGLFHTGYTVAHQFATHHLMLTLLLIHMTARKFHWQTKKKNITRHLSVTCQPSVHVSMTSARMWHSEHSIFLFPTNCGMWNNQWRAVHFTSRPSVTSQLVQPNLIDLIKPSIMYHSKIKSYFKRLVNKVCQKYEMRA